MSLEYIVIYIALTWFLLGILGLWCLSTIPAYRFPTCNRKQQAFLIIVGGPAFWLFIVVCMLAGILWRFFDWLGNKPQERL